MNIENLINTITQSTDIPLLTAFLLGILTAVNPCQLAINISALTYEYKNGNGWKDALTYSFGRTITYTLMGWVSLCLLGGGSNINGIENLLSKGETLLPYIMIALGVFLVSRGFHHHHHDGENCHNSGMIIRRNGPLGSLILGMTLALAFCPESAILYFGLMIPLSINSSVGFMLPLIYGLGACLPVVFIAWFMERAQNKARRISLMFESFQLWFNRVLGLVFIILGVLFFF